MVRRLPQLLAILTACSTMLAGIPLFAAAPTCVVGSDACISAAPCDSEDPVDPRGESAEKELEEQQEQQEDVDARIHLFAGTAVTIQLKASLTGTADPDACPATRSFSAPPLSIRGPPHRG